MIICRWLIYVGCCLFLPLAATAHEGHHGPHEHDDSQSEGSSQHSALQLPAIEGPHPWSEQPALDDPDRFSIAIVTDRTGGHRPGIWMQAVQRINWLRPDFVVSVGDLIEGYSEDRDAVEAQWKEFLGFIDQLEMKFFFVPGNHDVTNPMMHELWREKFGHEWYSFDYRGVHFICLNSEDPEARLGEDQLAWLRKDLQQSSDARWTLVFMHKPLWVYAEREMAAGNPDPTGWKQIEALLASRDHTVFAGHVHNYVQYRRNEQHYFTLATTGGGSRLRGIPYGEFDHITWLTMEADGPRVANLLLDGILPGDVVTEEESLRFNRFLEAVQLEVSPIFVDADSIQSGQLQISLRNEHDHPVKVEAEIEGIPLVGLDLQQSQIEITAAAGQQKSLTIPFRFRQRVDLKRFRSTTIEATLTADSDPPVRAVLTIPVTISRQHHLPSQSITVDGSPEEWKTGWIPNATAANTVDRRAQWKGEQDASVQLSAVHDGSSVFIRARIKDDRLTEDDQLILAIDPRHIRSRLSRNQLSEETIACIICPPPSGTRQECRIVAYNRDEPAPGMVAWGVCTADGYEIEVALPIESIEEGQGPAWTSLQLGGRLIDVDETGEPPVEFLWNSSRNIFANREYVHMFRQVSE